MYVNPILGLPLTSLLALLHLIPCIDEADVAAVVTAVSVEPVLKLQVMAVL